MKEKNRIYQMMTAWLLLGLLIMVSSSHKFQNEENDAKYGVEKEVSVKILEVTDLETENMFQIEKKNYVTTLSNGIENHYNYRCLTLNVGTSKKQISVTWVVDEDSRPRDTTTAFVQLKIGENIHTYETEKGEYNSNIEATTYRITLDVATNTVYQYRIGDTSRWSDWFDLRIGADDGEYTFLVAGDPQIGASDAGSSSDGTAWNQSLAVTSSWFGMENIDFLLSVGDQVQGSSSRYKEQEYDALFAPSFLREIPMIVNVGNHEVSPFKTSYSAHFTVPDTVDSNTISDLNAGYMSGNYWFEYEGTLFLSLNSNYSDCASHVAFMEQAQADFIKLHGTPDWQIVTFHHSIFSCGKHASSSSILELREGLADSLSELNIDVVLMGHDHVYTRSVMLQGSLPTTSSNSSDGFTPLSSVTDPKNGEVLYLTLNSASGSKYNSIVSGNYNYIAVQNQESVPNMSKISVSGSTLTVTTYRTGSSHFVDDIIDEFTIHRVYTANSLEKSDIPLENENDVVNFSDVNTDSWFYNAVSFVVERNLFSGVNEKEFAPTETMTHAMIWVVLANYAGEIFEQSGETWYSNAQAWAMAQGITEGSKPNVELTREELIQSLYLLEGSPETKEQDFSGFADGEAISLWATQSMAWAVNQGLLKGDNLGKLNPKDQCNRAEVATILMNYIINIETNSSIGT